ncbi:glycosyltransferase family 2 protein [Clostridium sp. YIM B02505]|uniref:Glycosyltransferase family 2 protein n=1 Tax=Clostridium yunnanense TaxID=2800325 RepID=A0ABS1EWX6_9CLOT|nr:glycosyltransferase family 2 protein [Clostridium yunnanense]MBK1813889.1 glycosyltransferase family 2 protein [Clostridium yunnanense]
MDSEKGFVSIILVNYNGEKDTVECIKSIENCVNQDNYNIIIVDNKSKEDSVKYIEQNITDKCILIKSDKNLGFAGGNNIGIKYALDHGADYIALLNNDTIVETDFIAENIQVFNKYEDAGIVGCRINYFSDKDISWYEGGYLDWDRYLGVHYGCNGIESMNFKADSEITFVTGCFMLIKRQVFAKTGLLPEEYFMYMEDVDFCAKVLDCKFKIIYNPNCIIYHKVSMSSGGQGSAFELRYINRNRIIFSKKYRNRYSTKKKIKNDIKFYLAKIFRTAEYFIKADNEKARAIISGVIEGIKFKS